MRLFFSYRSILQKFEVARKIWKDNRETVRNYSKDKCQFKGLGKKNNNVYRKMKTGRVEELLEKMEGMKEAIDVEHKCH